MTICPFSSDAARILVVRPPLLWPIAWSSGVPWTFLAPVPILVNVNYCAVDHKGINPVAL